MPTLRWFDLVEYPERKEIARVAAASASKALLQKGYDAYGFGQYYEIAILEWRGFGWRKEKYRWIEAVDKGPLW